MKKATAILRMWFLCIVFSQDLLMDGDAGNVLIVHTLVTVATAVPKGHLNIILSTSPSCTSGTSLVSNASAESQGTPCTPCTPCTCESRENCIDFEAKLVACILPAHASSSQVIQHQSKPAYLSICCRNPSIRTCRDQAMAELLVWALGSKICKDMCQIYKGQAEDRLKKVGKMKPWCFALQVLILNAQKQKRQSQSRAMLLQKPVKKRQKDSVNVYPKMAKEQSALYELSQLWVQIRCKSLSHDRR